MAKRQAKAAMAATILAGVMVGDVAAAAPPELITVVVHVKDCERVPARELAAAKQLASDVYEQIGVQLLWTDGASALAPSDGLRHVDLFILDAAMTARHNSDPVVFGQAGHLTGRAYIYYPRILAYAIRSNSEPARVLALVFAHELGHVLLPAYSHGPTGLMRAAWEGRIVAVPAFDPPQADTIRATLTARQSVE
ncbi:MAG TPA: hypothetical protein VM032_02035 [Vicinamibacterales bacterium]|nr:hypothetical protein [Vicinamibacterales bacterium]